MITVTGSRDGIWFPTNTARSSLEKCEKTILSGSCGRRGAGKEGLSLQRSAPQPYQQCGEGSAPAWGSSSLHLCLSLW